MKDLKIEELKDLSPNWNWARSVGMRLIERFKNLMIERLGTDDTKFTLERQQKE
jgi:hypothetical protein